MRRIFCAQAQARWLRAVTGYTEFGQCFGEAAHTNSELYRKNGYGSSRCAMRALTIRSPQLPHCCSAWAFSSSNALLKVNAPLNEVLHEQLLHLRTTEEQQRFGSGK